METDEGIYSQGIMGDGAAILCHGEPMTVDEIVRRLNTYHIRRLRETPMETMQQPKITGYRQLNESEAALMNEIKAHGEALAALCNRVAGYLDTEQEIKKAAADASKIAPEDHGSDECVELRRFMDAQPQRWAAIGRTHLQEGLTALTRAVAQPTTF